MKTNMLKTGIAIIIAIACSYNLFCHSDGCRNPSSINFLSQVQLGKEKNAFCHSDGCQNPSSIKSPSQVELGKESLSRDKSSDDCQSSDDFQVAKVTTDSGWVQKDGYLENALQVGSISFFRYSNDGQYLFTFGSDYTFRKWDVKTGKVLKELDFNYLTLNNSKITSFDFKHSEDKILISTDETVKPFLKAYIYNYDTLSCIIDNLFEQIQDLYNIHDKSISVFVLDEILFGLNYVVFGKKSFITGLIGWSDIDSCKYKSNDSHFGASEKFLVSNNQNFVLMSFHNYGDEQFHSQAKLVLKDVKSNLNLVIQDYSDNYIFRNLAFSNNSKYLTATRGSLYTLCWDIDEEKIIYLIRQPNLKNTQFSADDRFLITTLEKPDTSIIKFFLAETGVEADSIYFASKTHNGLIAVAPDSVNIAIAGNDGRIRIFQPNIFTKTYKTYFAADSIFKQLGNPIQFSDYSLPNAKSWKWDFGDGTKSYEQNPVHNYQAKGLYTVKLITSNGIQTDTMIKKDYIRMLIPVVADYDTYTSQDTVPFQVKFNNKSQGDIISYIWIVNNKVASIEENPIMYFAYWGNYDVTLIITDGYFSDTLFIKERIKAIPPTIPFFTNLMEKRFYDEEREAIGIKGIETENKSFLFIGEYYDRYYNEDNNEFELEYAYSLLFKIDSIGNIIWSIKSNYLKYIIQTKDSCYIGIGDYFGSTKMFFARKYNQNGELIWEKTYPRQSNDNVNNIYLTDDYGFMIIGASYYNYKAQTAVLKADKDGNQIWYKYFDGWGGNIINSGDENLLLVTYYVNSNDILIIKIDKEGKIINQNLYEDYYNAIPIESIALKNGNIIVACYYKLSDYPPNYKSYLVMLDSNNNKIWEYLKEEEFNKYNSIVSLGDSLFLVTGNFNNQIGVDIINNQGELVNSVRFPERSGAINSIVTTKDNDLFLTGSITPPYKLSQLYTLLLKHPYIITSVEEEQTENIANPEQPFSIFPNPTNSTATLQYKFATPTHLKIELIDFMGMKVSELENTFKEAGKYNTLINLENLKISKGIYFVRFIANGNVFICKLVYV